jgi:replicative DNA helicase
MSGARTPGASEVEMGIERALIGGCLLDTRGCREWPILQASYFYIAKNRAIWQAMIDLTEVTDRPDVGLLLHELHRAEVVLDERLGNAPYLAQLLEEGMGCYDLGRYGEIVRRGAAERDRQLLAAALLAEPEGSERVEAILRSLEEQPGRAEPLSNIYPRLEAGQTGTLINVGFQGMDLRVGTVTAFGARTSHAKTALACHLSKEIARQDYAVDYITLEDPAEAIAARLIAGEARKSVYYVRVGRLAGLDAERRALEMLPIMVTSVPGCREAAVIGAVAASRADVVVLDHLQQIAMDGNEDSRNHQIERIMGRLGAIARRDNKALLLLVQLSREMDRQKRQPTLADLKDSGAIEQSARSVWLGYWPSKHSPDKRDPEDYLVKLEKVSEGATFPKWLKWDAKSGWFWEPGKQGESNE